MALPADFDRMENDFLSGRNPLAYIPLCHALRRQKYYARALELCQRGLAGDPDSVAGRALYARLLADLGHYEDALREITRAEAKAPHAQGLLLEKTRCLIRLKDFGAAELTLSTLNQRNPLDPEVQLLNAQFRQASAGSTWQRVRASATGVPRMLRLTDEEILEKVGEQMEGMCTVLSLMLIPLQGRDPLVSGSPEILEGAVDFYEAAARACEETGVGSLRLQILESERGQLIVLVRRQALMALCIEPTPHFGKVFHRFQSAVSQLLPEAHGESAAPETRRDA